LQVFISWSGPQSEHVAHALRNWLPKVLDSKVKPFVSSKDIDKGDRGLNKIAAELEASSYGIVVVTPNNQDSPWINFEAGALGKSVSDSRVAPLLIGLTDSDVSGPLKQFQNTSASDMQAVRSLVHSLNKTLTAPMGDGTVDVMFERYWNELETAIAESPDEDSQPQQEPREQADLLDEVLTTVRSLQRDVGRMQTVLERSARQRSEEFDDAVTGLLMRELELASLGWTSNDDGITVELPQQSPKLAVKAQRALQELIKAYGMSVRIERTDGSSLTYSPQGKESRTQPTIVNDDSDE
jgi:hypothetical protein